MAKSINISRLRKWRYVKFPVWYMKSNVNNKQIRRFLPWKRIIYKYT